jgi:stage IV sporulation protein FB
MILDGPKFKIFTFVGAPVRLSLLFFLLLPMVGFDMTMFISIFIAILIHEMAHAFVARKKGYTVYGIDLDLFAGAASLDANMHQRDSMWVSLAGPASNLILAVLSLLLLPQLPSLQPFLHTFFGVNVFLFVFNMLPIYPMDGGMAFSDFLMLNMRNRRLAADIANKTSLTFCVLGFVAALLLQYFIMAIFFGIFFYQTYKRAGYGR